MEEQKWKGREEDDWEGRIGEEGRRERRV